MRVTTVSNLLIFDIERVGDKSFKEWRQKIGGRGGKVGDNNILTF